MTTKKTQVVKANNSKELAVKLSNFNYSVEEYKENQILVFEYDWTNPEKKTTGTKTKLFGIQGDEKRLDFLWFKAKLEEKKTGSLAYFGSQGFLKIAIEEGLLSEELV